MLDSGKTVQLDPVPDLVIDDLRRDVASLQLTASDLGRGDAQSSQATARLSGRLG